MINITRRNLMGGLAAFPAFATPLGTSVAEALRQPATGYSGPGLYELRPFPGRAFYVGPMPPRWPFGRRFVQAHALVSSYPDPRQATMIFAKANAGATIVAKLAVVSA